MTTLHEQRDPTAAPPDADTHQLALWERRRTPRWTKAERARNLARVRRLRRVLARAEGEEAA